MKPSTPLLISQGNLFHPCALQRWSATYQPMRLTRTRLVLMLRTEIWIYLHSDSNTGGAYLAVLRVNTKFGQTQKVVLLQNLDFQIYGLNIQNFENLRFIDLDLWGKFDQMARLNIELQQNSNFSAFFFPSKSF